VGRYRTAVTDARRAAPGITELEALTKGLQGAAASADAETRKRFEPLLVQGYAQLAHRAIVATLPITAEGTALSDSYYYDVLKRAAKVKDQVPDVKRAIDAAVTPIIDGLDAKTRDKLNEFQKDDGVRPGREDRLQQGARSDQSVDRR
jgi:hypothetical protein